MPDDNATIFPDAQELIDKLRLTSRCRKDIGNFRFLHRLPAPGWKPWTIPDPVRRNNALGILMNIVAVIGVRLRSRILADTLK